MAHGSSNAWRRKCLILLRLIFPTGFFSAFGCPIVAPYQQVIRTNKKQRADYCEDYYDRHDVNEGEQASVSERLDRSKRFARQFLFQTDITLFAGDQIAKHFLYAAVSTGKLNHSFGERRAPEVSIKPPAHL